jgi:class 3 adenylate cyclase/tetratricopeptide (TPR) repeat protein
MECPKCQADNSDIQKFCGECGTKLERICPACNSLNPPQFKFCGECGHDLKLPAESRPKDLSFDDKLDKIQRYLPKGLTEKVLSQKDKIEGERKQVTVMFCDMEGFTPIVEKLGPEEAYAVMDQVYEILIHKVHDYEGTVNEMTGDGIMALFGAPIALEDAPHRAIRSAYAIHREIARFSDRMSQEKPKFPPLKMRVGIHSGPVVVGTLGNNLRVEFKAVGDTVNLSSRLEGLAEPGTTYVSDAVFKLTEGFFRFEELGERKVKGKEKPVNVFRVIAPSTLRTRFDVSAERGLTPLVGRKRELELLMDGFKRSKSGRGQAFFIMAEAGTGKSRLLYEFRKMIANEDATFLEGKCLSYIRGIAYHPIIEALKSNFDVLEKDGDPEITEKVKLGLKILGVDEESTLPYLLELLSVKGSGIDKISMSPEAMKHRLIEAVTRISLRGSEIRPLILAFEDLHWIDKNSEDCLKALSDSIPGSRIFLIFTYRPEFVHSWGTKSYHSQINLNRLSNRESQAIVTHLLGTEDIDKELDKLTLEKTEGVPLFIEEFIKSLKDLKIIEKKNNTYQMVKETQALNIPSTIQDVIMARVDLLPEDSKKLLQIGSVIEREFRYELLKWVTGLPKDELLSNLSILKDSELLYERGIYPQSSYIFKHALTREIVYDSLFNKKRKELHKEIGNAIEKIYRDNLNEHCEVLSEHYFISENYSKAAYYSRMAGKKAEKTASLNEAIFYAEKRVNSLEYLQQTEDIQREIIDARTSLGLYMFQLYYFVKARAAVKSVYEPATNLQYFQRLAQINTIIGAHSYWVKEEFSNAFQSLKKAKEISIELNDVLSAFFSNQWLGFAYSYCCNFEKAKKHFLNALKINKDAQNEWGTSVVLSCLSHWVFNYCGLIEKGYEASKKALRVALKSGDIYSKAIAFSMHGLSLYFKGQTVDATFHFLKGIDLNNKINFSFTNAEAHFYLASIYYDNLDFDNAERNFAEAIKHLQRIECLPSKVRLCELKIFLTRLCKNQNIPELDSVLSEAKKNKLKVYEGWTCRTVSEILAHVNGGNLEEAEVWIKKAIESDESTGNKWSLARNYMVYTKILAQKGYEAEAKKHLIKAESIFKSCGADGWIARLNDRNIFRIKYK